MENLDFHILYMLLFVPLYFPINLKERDLRIGPIVVFIYPISLPLELGTIWFRMGLPICLSGIVIYMLFWVNMITTPMDRPMKRDFKA